MSRLIEGIVRSLTDEHLNVPIESAAVFAFFTAVKSRRLGLSMTLFEDDQFNGFNHQPVRHMGKIETLSLKELLSWTGSNQPIERSIGLAALNSCLPLSGFCFSEGNALDLVARLGEGKNVVVVGHFPHLERIRATARSMVILEKRPQAGDLPAEAAPKVIPGADVVAITGVTCLNDTIEGLLALKKPGAIFVLLGPTVPMHPDLFTAGIDVIAGAWVDDPDAAIPMLRHGATARVLKGLRFVLAARNANLLQGLPAIRPPEWP
jgi:hypothetical protein